MGIILVNIIAIIMFWGFALFYRPKRDKDYVPFHWFFIIVFGIVAYYFAISYFLEYTVYELNDKAIIISEYLISIPLITIYTFLSIFVKEKIYKKRDIIYPIMLILGILISVCSIFPGVLTIFASLYICFIFPYTSFITMVLVLFSISLGRKKDKNDTYFEKKNTDLLIEDEKKDDDIEEVDIPISDETKLVYNTIFIISLIGAVIIAIVCLVN